MEFENAGLIANDQSAFGGRREIKVVVTCCRPDPAGLTVLCST